MADSKISQLPDALLPLDTDLLTLARGVTNVKMLWSTLLTGVAFSKIESKVATGADVSNFDFQSIPNSYSHLLLIAQLRTDVADTNDGGVLRFNNVSTAIYSAVVVSALNGSITTGDNHSNNMRAFAASGNTAPAGSVAYNFGLIPYYANTNWHKSAICLGGDMRAADPGAPPVGLFWTANFGRWPDTSAINRVTLIPNNGNVFKQNCRADLWGIK